MLIPFCLTAAQPRAFGAPDPFEHLDALFRYAQLLTADAEQAAALVEATYRQAQTSERPVRDRTDLLNLLTIVHRERMERPAGPVPPAATALHRRLARAYAETVLPRLFAALPDDDRLVLHLRAVEQLSWAEAGRLLGTTAAMAEARFERAVAALHRHLYAGASPADRRLLDQGLEAEDVPRILAQTLAAHLTPVPPTLRPRVAAALHTPAEPTRPTPPARTPPLPKAGPDVPCSSCCSSSPPPSSATAVPPCSSAPPRST
ncbi:hypothetical protein AWN76_006810 [Rhodothermaceae bacterium RA]|nr:hypothetical protein AWN76_006810 [Rhodothermaceae bacterium RA]